MATISVIFLRINQTKILCRLNNKGKSGTKMAAKWKSWRHLDTDRCKKWAGRGSSRPTRAKKWAARLAQYASSPMPNHVLPAIHQSLDWSIYRNEKRTIHTSNLDRVFSFSSLNRWAASFPLQQFWRRNQASELEWFRRVIWSPVPSLPPVMIILSHDVKNVTGWERQTGLSARYRVIGWRIIIKQSSYKYLHQKYFQIC